MFEISVALIVVTFALLFWYLYKICWTYWQRLGVPTYPKINFPLGHMKNPFTKDFTNIGLIIKDYYQYFKEKNFPFGGLYLVTTPIFVPMDLDLIKQIMIKDFDSFDEKGLFYNEEKQPVSAHLFQIGGKRWKNLRVKLTPTFTSGKMKLMFPSVIQCTEPMMQLLNSQKDSSINVKVVSGKFTTDVIGSCAFGIQCNSFQNNDFHHYASKTFETGTIRAAKRTTIQFLPRLAKIFGFLPFPMEVTDFFERITMENVKVRKAETNATKRNDFIQLLIELYEKDQNNGGITMQELLAQAFLFFNAGYETSASTMTYCLYELAQHQDIQDKLRDEINEVFAANNGQLTYQSLGDLKYLQQVMEEALRLHPPVTVINRECSKDYSIAGTNVCLPKGTKMFVPAMAIHYDKTYYPDPLKFDPERFSEENKQSRHHCAFMAFGDGPRICIGSRFAYMQVKVGLCYLLREHRFSTCPETPIPLTYDGGFILSARNDIILKCEKL